MKTCISTLKDAQAFIRQLSDPDLLEGIEHHKDPSWWKMQETARSNIAYLRRWGSCLRREARSRGLY